MSCAYWAPKSRTRTLPNPSPLLFRVHLLDLNGLREFNGFVDREDTGTETCEVRGPAAQPKTQAIRGTVTFEHANAVASNEGIAPAHGRDDIHGRRRGEVATHTL